MQRKKRLIWWEGEPVAGGAEESRARGLRVVSPWAPGAVPYYGPVTLSSPGAATADSDGGVVTVRS